jgi:hypothetical protein
MSRQYFGELKKKGVFRRVEPEWTEAERKHLCLAFTDIGPTDLVECEHQEWIDWVVRHGGDQGSDCYGSHFRYCRLPKGHEGDHDSADGDDFGCGSESWPNDGQRRRLIKETTG